MRINNQISYQFKYINAKKKQHKCSLSQHYYNYFVIIIDKSYSYKYLLYVCFCWCVSVCVLFLHRLNKLNAIENVYNSRLCFKQ